MPPNVSTVDIQWTEVREELVRVSEGVAISPETLMTVSPTILIFTARDWNVPQPLLLLPLNDDVYNGNRVAELVFTLNSPTFPVSQLHTEDVAIRALITMSLAEDDPMLLPISGITSALDRRVWLHEGITHELGYTLPRAPTSPVSLHIIQTPVGITGAGDSGLDLVLGEFAPSNYTLTIQNISSHFDTVDWQLPHLVTLQPEDDGVFTDYLRQYIRLDYFFTGADPFYYEATVVPTHVVASENDAGCPQEYQCLNRGTCVPATFPPGNSFDALSRPFAFGGACDCYTAFGGRSCQARTFEFIRLDFLMQAEILTELDIDFEDRRSWPRLAGVLEVCPESVYIKSMEPAASCDPGDALEPLMAEEVVRARQAAGFYDDDGNVVDGVDDLTDAPVPQLSALVTTSLGATTVSVANDSVVFEATVRVNNALGAGTASGVVATLELPTDTGACPVGAAAVTIVPTDPFALVADGCTSNLGATPATVTCQFAGDLVGGASVEVAINVTANHLSERQCGVVRAQATVTFDGADGLDLGLDPYATCSTGTGEVPAPTLDTAECIVVVVDITGVSMFSVFVCGCLCARARAPVCACFAAVASHGMCNAFACRWRCRCAGPDGSGDFDAAEAARTRFTQLQLQWARAGAAAASITGLNHVASMQFNNGQRVQEILRTPLPPVDRSWKLKHYTMLMCAVIAGICLLTWISWRYDVWHGCQGVCIACLTRAS